MCYWVLAVIRDIQKMLEMQEDGARPRKMSSADVYNIKYVLTVKTTNLRTGLQN